MIGQACYLSMKYEQDRKEVVTPDCCVFRAMAYEALGLIEGRLAAVGGTGPASQLQQAGRGAALQTADPRSPYGRSRQGQEPAPGAAALAGSRLPLSFDDFRERAQLAALLAHVRNGEPRDLAQHWSAMAHTQLAGAGPKDTAYVWG